MIKITPGGPMSGEEGEVAPPPGEAHTAVVKEEVSLHVVCRAYIAHQPNCMYALFFFSKFYVASFPGLHPDFIL